VLSLRASHGADQFDAKKLNLRVTAQFSTRHGVTQIDILKSTPRLRAADSEFSAEILTESEGALCEYHSERDRRLLDSMLAETMPCGVDGFLWFIAVNSVT